jgi:hypothetical protein
MNFNVYVIHSAKPLADLKRALEECGGYTYAGIIYKSLHRKNDRGHTTEKEETKKTIVFCPEQSIKRLEVDFPTYKGRIASYEWQSFPMPDEQLESWNLHISGVPNDYTVRDAELLITNSLSCILPVKDEVRVNYTVEFIPRLRETGEIYGYGHINFSEHVNHDLIKLCKLVLHNTPINFKSNPKDKRMVTCVWHRVNNESRDNSKKPESPEFKEKKYGKSTPKKQNLTNVRRSKPAPVRQVDVSNIAPDPSVDTVKIENNNKHGVVSTK